MPVMILHANFDTFIIFNAYDEYTNYLFDVMGQQLVETLELILKK